jgi:hypothetical protein
MPQPKQRRLRRCQFFQRLPVDAGNDAGDQPARLAHLNDDDQRTILIQSGERSAQIILLWHGALRRLSQRRWCLVLATRPIASLPERFGDWKNRHRRFSRWAKNGMWQSVFEPLAADADSEYAMIDSPIMRAHQHSAGAPKKR